MNAMTKPAPAGGRVDNLDPKAIVAAQKAAGVPEFLLRMQMRPSMMMEGAVGDREYLDGMVIAENTFNLVALDGASGKSTSSRGSGAFAADSGLWTMFGTRQHSKPLKVVLIHGEETEEEIVQSFRTVPGAKDAYLRAVASGRLIVTSVQDAQQRAERAESVFDKDGRLTNYGRELFDSLREFNPDVLILDTLTSIADTEYLDSLSPRNTINELNRFCSQTRCTAIGYLHFTKDAGAKVRADSTPAELLSLSRGSAMLKNISRSFIVATRAPADMYSIEAKKGDEIWVGTTKCNLQGAEYNHRLFPIVRDSRRMVLSAQSGEQSIAEDVAARDAEISRELREMLPRLIRASSERRKPFAAGWRKSGSIEKMSQESLVSLFPQGCSPKLITATLNDLVKNGVIVQCTITRSGSGEIYDVPGGIFTDELAWEEANGEPLKIFKGTIPAAELEARMLELEDGTPDPQEQLREKIARDGDLVDQLRTMLPVMIRAGAELYKPFAISERSDSSIQSMSAGELSSLFPDGTVPRLIDAAIADLIKAGSVVRCSSTRSGSGVYDVPGGIFADQAEFERITGEAPKVAAGSVPVAELRDRMDRIEEGALHALDRLRAEADLAAAQKADDEARDQGVVGELKQVLPRIIRAGAALHKPFPISSKSDASLQSTSDAAYSALFPAGSTPRLIDQALAELVRAGVILECSVSRSGSGAVYDVPAGPFADPEAYEAMTETKLAIFPGAISADALRNRMDELDDISDADDLGDDEDGDEI